MKKGFTIVELMAVAAILVILMSIVVVSASGAMKSSREKRAAAMQSALNQGLAAYYAQEGKWPSVIETKVDQIEDTYTFSATETDQIFREVVGKGFGKGSGIRSMLVDASALFVADANKIKNSGRGCMDNHKDQSESGYCGNQNCIRGIDFSEAVKKDSKYKIPFAQMAFGYPGKVNGRFRRFWIKYNSRTDSCTVTK
jgi:prepilin-type N-terminal cleavage/methylation domain-containing protein